MFGRRVCTAGVILVLALIVNACSNPIQPSPSPTVAVQGVKVTPQVVQFDAIGETKDLSATVVPADATDKTITWESTDPTVASVDANGRVTAHAVGFGVFITAITRDGRHQASANISVDPQ